MELLLLGEVLLIPRGLGGFYGGVFHGFLGALLHPSSHHGWETHGGITPWSNPHLFSRDNGIFPGICLLSGGAQPCSDSQPGLLILGSNSHGSSRTKSREEHSRLSRASPGQIPREWAPFPKAPATPTCLFPRIWSWICSHFSRFSQLSVALSEEKLPIPCKDPISRDIQEVSPGVLQEILAAPPSPGGILSRFKGPGSFKTKEIPRFPLFFPTSWLLPGRAFPRSGLSLSPSASPCLSREI